MSESNYDKLFGTPERVAITFATIDEWLVNEVHIDYTESLGNACKSLSIETCLTHDELVALVRELMGLGERIVRCRDCKYHELQCVSYSDKPFSVCTAEWCEGSDHDNPLVEPDGFCAWGERKEA